MTLIATIILGSPVGQAAIEAVPDMELRLEDIRSLADEPWRFIFWAAGDDFETYEAALDTDPTIESYECLTTLPDKRLYRFVLSEEGQQQTLQPIAVDYDITIIQLTITAEKQELLARFPSRESVVNLRDACRERDRKFKLLALHEERPIENDGGYNSRYGVTAAQREALLAALEMGYFDVPRETTMDVVAENVGVSTSALSTRLRRGQQSLLRHTLAQESAL